jgi:hypothetical protein
MTIEIPDGWALFAWKCGDAGVFLIVAPDEEQAYERAIDVREKEADSRDEAERGFAKNDDLHEVVILEEGDGTIRA